jgi:hypothetical protein
MGDKKRQAIRREILSYLQKFYLDFILYKELPIINKIYCKAWASDMYEQLDDGQRLKLYLKLTEKSGE